VVFGSRKNKRDEKKSEVWSLKSKINQEESKKKVPLFGRWKRIGVEKEVRKVLIVRGGGGPRFQK